MTDEQFKKLSINISGDKNDHQSNLTLTMDTKLEVLAITCNSCKETFVIYKPEFQRYESGESRSVLVSLEQTAYCPFCGN